MRNGDWNVPNVGIETDQSYYRARYGYLVRQYDMQVSESDSRPVYWNGSTNDPAGGGRLLAEGVVLEGD